MWIIMDICSGAENTIHTEQMESIARFPWFFRIKMQLSHLYRNAAEEKNLCAQFMILFAQNYKGRNVVGSSYMGILQLKSPLVSFLLENGIRKAPSPEKHFQKSTWFLLNFWNDLYYNKMINGIYHSRYRSDQMPFSG